MMWYTMVYYRCFFFKTGPPTPKKTLRGIYRMSLELGPNIILLLFWGVVQLWRDCAIRHRCMSCQLGKPSCHRNMADIDMLWFLDFEWFWMMFTCNFPDISKTIHHLRMHFWSAVAQITLRPMPSHSGARKPRRSAKDLRLTAEPLMKFEESTGEKNVWFGLIFSEILRFAEHDPRHLRPCSKMCLGLPLSQLCSTRRHDGCYNSWILLHWPVIKDAFCSEAWKPDLLSGEELGKILVAGYRERQRFNRWRCDEGYVGITDRQLFTAWVLDCNLSSKAVQFFQWN